MFPLVFRCTINNMNFLKVNRYPTEKLKAAEVNLGSFQPGTMVIFFDKGTKQPPDESGCNQTGVLLTNRNILFVRNGKLVEINFTKLNPLLAFALPFRSLKLSSRILKYFESNKGNQHLFMLGLEALKVQGEEFSPPPIIMPKLTTYKSVEAYEDAWNNLLPQLQKADLVCTFNEKSLLSMLIANLDKGTWSHSALYVGGGQICEAIKDGVVKRDIKVYKNKHIHIGIYRRFDMTPQLAEAAVQRALLVIGRGYSYRKAMRLGLRLVFGLKIDLYRPGDVTPNGLIYRGGFHLVGYV